MASMADVPKTILMLGKTGSGKGTQAELLAAKLGYKTFSTGDRFREIMQREDPIGHRIRELHEAGKLVPHWFASYLFEERFLSADVDDGIVTEGVGRTREEAVLFDEVMGWLGREYVALELLVSDESVIGRQLKRGRTDSNTEEKLETRLSEYRSSTARALDFFREQGKLKTVDGEPPVEQVFENVCTALGIS